MTVIIFFVCIAVLAISLAVSKDKPATNQQSQLSNNQQSDDEVLENAQRLMAMNALLEQAKAHNDEATVQAILNMTYNGPLPKLKTGGYYTNLYKQTISYPIAGINFRKGIAKYEGRFVGYLKPDLKNEHDPNAIAIHHEDGKHLGFIPMDRTDEVRQLGFEFPISVIGFIDEDYDYNEERKYFTGSVYLEIESNTIVND